MEWLAPYPLVGIIVLSALGALVMCGLALSGRRSAPPRATVDRGRFVTRRGHVCTAVCFGVIAVLGAVTLTTRAPSVHAPPAASQPPDAADVGTDLMLLVRQLAAEVVRLRGELSRVNDQAREQLSDGGGPLGAAPSVPPTKPMTPERHDGDARRPGDRAVANGSSVQSSPAMSRRHAADARVGDGAEEFSLEMTPEHLRVTVGNVRVEVGSDQDTAYIVRLLESSGQPLLGARIVLHGLGADGTTVEVPFEPTHAPGTYRGRLATTDPLREPRLRVVLRDTRFELPLADEPSQLARSRR